MTRRGGALFYTFRNERRRFSDPPYYTAESIVSLVEGRCRLIENTT